jgi:hypothetical protein
MDRSSWVFQLTPEELERAVRAISGPPRSRLARVTRRGRGKRPWIILVDGVTQSDRLGRPRRFKTRRAALAKVAELDLITGRGGRR